jgi:hypothetical protein
MVNVLASSAVGRGFETRFGQTLMLGQTDAIRNQPCSENTMVTK